MPGRFYILRYLTIFRFGSPLIQEYSVFDIIFPYRNAATPTLGNGKYLTRLCLLTSTILAVLLGTAGFASVNAAPLYVGLQSGSGAIAKATLSAIPGGGFSFASQQIDSSGIWARGTIEGTPPLPEPFLISATTDLAGRSDPLGGVVSIYMTETNQFPITFSSYFENFATSIPPLYLGHPNAVLSVTESIYVHNCGGIPCNTSSGIGGDVFNLDQLVATTTFTATGATSAISPITPGLTAPYTVTELYTVTFGPGSETAYGDVISSIKMSVPEPLSLALLATGLIGPGFARSRQPA